MATARVVLSISEQEIVDAIAGAVAQSNAPEAKTAKEIVEATGQSAHAVNRALNALAKQGRLGVHRMKFTGRDQISRTTIGYTILAKKK